MNIRSSQTSIYDHTRPTDPQMSSKPQKGLTGNIVIPVSRLFSQSTAAICSGKTTHWHRKAIHQRYLAIKRHLQKQFLPDAFFDLPEISSLACKNRTMDAHNCRKPVCIMPFEEGVQSLIRINAQKFTDDFNCDQFAITQSWLWSAFPQSVSLYVILGIGKPLFKII